MAEQPKVIKESDIEKKSIVIANIVLQSPDRTPKDIADWIRAVEAAESVYAPQRVLLYDLYSRIEMDGQFTGVWERKRVSQVLNKKLLFKKNKQKVDELDTLISSDMFRNFIKLRMQQKKDGLSGAEFIPGPSFTFIEVDRKHIKPEKRVISKEQYQDTGFSYDGVWNFYIMGTKKDKGLLLNCAPYILWKQGVFGDWAQFIQIFGLPARLFKYDVYDEKTKKEAADLQKNAGSAMSMIIPKQLDFEMLDGKTSNSNGDLQDKFRKACNEEISIIVVGNTETTNSSSSSGYAQSQTHSDEQQEVIADDMQDILNTLNDPHFLTILKSYGYPVDGGAFEYEQPVNLDKLAKRKDIDKEIAKIVPIDDDYWYDTYNIPKPANYKELKEKMEARKVNPDPHDNPDDDPVPGKKDKKKVKRQKVKDNAADALSMIEKIRLKLADFFDPAHKS